MALDFVGMDPNSQQDKCPAVYVDPASGDGLFVGKTVDDPLVVTQMNAHGSIGADEAIVRMPKRMWPIIAEAAAGNYEAGRAGPGHVTFADLIAVTRRSAVHLEMRDAYEPDDPGFAAWKAGRSYDDPSHARWRELVGRAVARGVRFRVRIITEPVTEYIRFEHSVTADLNIAAGEDVRWLPRRQALGLMLPAHDFWLFDNRLVRFHHFLADDRIDDRNGDKGDTFTSDPATVTACIAAFEQAWDRAISHGDYDPK